ncbi:hypothetical protein [Chryseobacterium sediminis]|uniref:hypothetical protein n=1 Tax=Chryseobacterium sediminis TaxID=1679494 RepID=UPI00142EB752|nr:hypothetical protein [Chryseobacterium sediminis]
MKKNDLKKIKGILSRDEQRAIKGGKIADGGCGCTNAACANTHNGNGDSYCNGTFCCG